MYGQSSAEDIFSIALAASTLDERVALLNETCQGNESLRRQVEDLLSAHEEMGQFLARPIVEAETFARMSSDRTAAPLAFLDPPTEPESLGRLDHYEVLNVIGHGGMGIVLRARDTKLSRIVAIKVLATPLSISERARKWFAREARAAAAIRDDYVVAIYSVRDDAPVPFHVMEFIDGGNLNEFLKSRGPLDLKEILEIGIQIARGLAAAHKQGLIHRDIKPANILVESGLDRMKLTDFGLARAMDDASVSQNDLVAGTPMYMAPEQASSSCIDHRADLFSLGSVLYELCTGKSAFGAPTAIAAIKRVCDESAQPIRELRSDIPMQLCQLIDRMHAKDPADRPGSALEIAKSLRDLLDDMTSQRLVSMEGTSKTKSAGSIEVGAAIAIPSESYFALAPKTIRLSLLATLAIAVLASGLGLIVSGTWSLIPSSPIGYLSVRNRPEVGGDNSAELNAPTSITETDETGLRENNLASTGGEAWEGSVATLRGKDLVDAVIQRLNELNPGFDGVVESTIRDGDLVGLRFLSDHVKDISPLRTIKTLEDLECNGTYFRNGKLSDLSPIRGMKLQSLKCNSTLVQDLGPLQGMPLKLLICGDSLVSNLAPLEGMPMEILALQRTSVSDLTPLRGMPLTFLDLFCSGRIQDLRPLEGMPLEYLNLTDLKIPDLQPLAKMTTLRRLILESVPVRDFTPLQDLHIEVLCIRGSQSADLSSLTKLPLKILRLDYRDDRKEFVSAFPTLTTVNEMPIDQFWRKTASRN